MKKLALIAVITVFSFLSITWLPCQADQEPWVCPNDDTVNGLYWICNYFPLNPNNQWQYTTGEYHVANDVHTCSSGYSGILYASTTYEYSLYMQNVANGLLFAGCQYDGGVFEDSGGTYFMLIPPSISVGETVRILTDQKGTVDVSLVGVETITVPAGTFATLKVQWTRQANTGSCSYKTTAWLAKGIGMVKIHRTDADPADCLGCIFVCDPNNDVVKLNTPAELISFNSNQGNPKISIGPMSVNLGSVKVGSSSSRMVTIKNTGNGDLFINPITMSGVNQSEFTQTDHCSTVPAKSSCPITVTFSPLAPFGKKTAIMSISSNDLKKPTINVKLLGQAPPPKISVSPQSVNFGTVPVGSTSTTKIVTVKNTGTSDLTLNAITIIGTNDFSETNTNNCTTLAKGSSCRFSVTFTPTLTGAETATMSISTNDPKKPVVNVKLLGKGQSSAAPPIDLSGSWTFDSQVVSTTCDGFYVGQTKTANMTINMNGSNVELSSPNVQFGRSETRGQPITGHISGNVLTMIWNEPPNPTDPECPTCTWTVTINGVISSDLRTIEATLQKIGSGGECSTTMTFIGTKL